MYDPSGDSTIPSTSKKRKFEEVEEEEEPEEPVTPVVKTKKPKKEPVTEGEWTLSWSHHRTCGCVALSQVRGLRSSNCFLCTFFLEEAETSAAAEEPPKKKKKKKDKKAEVAEEPKEEEEEEEVTITEEVRLKFTVAPWNLMQRQYIRLDKRFGELRLRFGRLIKFYQRNAHVLFILSPVNRKEEKEEEKEGKGGGRRLKRVESLYIS